MFNYRLPEQCCGNCCNAYLSTYGDALCKMITGFALDAGGVCDWYGVTDKPVNIHKSFNAPLERKKLVVEIETCDGCTYSLEGMCIWKGTVVTKRCNKYTESNDGGSDNSDSLDDSSVAECVDNRTTDRDEAVVDIRTCSTCNYSYYNDDGVAICGKDNTHVTTDYSCKEWIK